MTRTTTWASVGTAFSVVVALATVDPPPATQGDPSALLKEVLAENLRATAAEDVDATMATVHPMSPAAASTRQALGQIFPRYDLKYEVLSSEFAGTTGEYAMMRVEQQTTRVAGPAFADNVIDTLQIFRKDGGRWKVWTSAILEVRQIP